MNRKVVIFVLYKTIYESLGAGLPFEQSDDTDFEIVDGKFILTLNRQFEAINMLISPIPEHSITVNGEKKYIAALFSESVESSSNEAHNIKIYAIRKKVFHLGNF